MFRALLALTVVVTFGAPAFAQNVLIHEIASFDHEPNGSPTEYTEGLDGMLYGVSAGTGTQFASVYRIDPRTGFREIAAEIDYGPDLPNSTFPTKMVRVSGGVMYGSYQSRGGIGGESGIFRFNPRTNEAAVVRTFPILNDGFGTPAEPDGAGVRRLFLGSDGWLYGSMIIGAQEWDAGGSIFKFDPASGTFVTLARPSLRTFFQGGDSMVEAAPGIWFGTYLSFDGSNPDLCASIYRFDAGTGEVSTVKELHKTVEGCDPEGLALHGDRIAGITTRGTGSFFSLDPATLQYTTLHQFTSDDDPRVSKGDVSVGADGLLYASYLRRHTPGGEVEKGIVRVDPATGAATKLAVLPDILGFLSDGTGFFVGTDGRLYGGIQLPFKAYAIAVLDGIPIAPASGPFGGTTMIAATLKAIGVPMAGRTIAFTLNGVAIGTAITGADGVATLNDVSVNGIAVGTYATAIGAAFGGDEHFPATAGAGSLSVVDVPTPGLVIGNGFIRKDDLKHEFHFAVHESAGGVNRGDLDVERKSKTSRDRFTSDAFTFVWFGDGITMFEGPGEWNGQAGYRFEALAQDGADDRLRLTIYDAASNVVVTLDDELDGGTIQSLRVRR